MCARSNHLDLLGISHATNFRNGTVRTRTSNSTFWAHDVRLPAA
jgi:hypothetical protein